MLQGQGLGLHLLAPRILMAQDSSLSREARTSWGQGSGEDPSRPGEASGPPPPCVQAAPHSRLSSWVSALVSLLPAPCSAWGTSMFPSSAQQAEITHPELSDTGDDRGSENRYGLFTCFPSEKPAQREGPGPAWTPTPALGPAIWGALDRGRLSHHGPPFH